MAEKALSWRRVALAALCILPFFLLFEAYIVYADMYPKQHDSLLGTASPDTRPTKTSQVHFLLPASSPNDGFCAVVASALVNRFPVPYIVGWRGEGKFNATAAHTAKLHSLKQYLDTLPQGGAPDDLVIFGDGHDVMAQLPADVVVERYFQVAAEADRRLADRFGIGVEEARARGLRQTLFWGADKMCWPPLLEEPQCAEIPFSHLPRSVFGPKSGGGDPTYDDARFFNSGSVIGPLGDLRRFIDAGIEAVEATFDPAFEYKFSDQIYLARLFARQEVSRTAQIKGEELEEQNGQDRQNVTEYHVAIDYESALVQTGCYSHTWMHWLNYNNSGNAALVFKDKFGQGKNFKPYPVQMPASVFRSLSRVFDSLLPEQRPAVTAREWVGSLGLVTNIVSRHIFGFYHATCSKKDLIKDFKAYWFHPLLKPLLRAAFRANKAGQPLAETLIDGRRWEYRTSYPNRGETEDELGGVFTDAKDEAYIPLTSLCKKNWDIFGG